MSKTFNAFFGKKIVGVVKPDIAYPCDSFEGKKFLKNVFFDRFWTASKQLLVFRPYFLTGFSELHSTWTLKHLNQKKHFFCWKEKQKIAIFRYRLKAFFDFWSKTSGHWAKNRQIFVGENMAWSWKLQFTCTYEFF